MKTWHAIEDYPQENSLAEPERKHKEKALAKICLIVKSCTYIYIQSVESAREAWLNLQKAYKDKGLIIKKIGIVTHACRNKAVEFQKHGIVRK